MADLKQYWQELAKKAGVSEEKMKAISEALGDDTVAKAFKDGFVETPTHHSTLDRMKGEWEGRATKAEQEAASVRDWYSKTAKPAFDQFGTLTQQLQAYQQTYGAIDGAGDVRRAAEATGLTKDQVEEILKANSAQKDQAYVNLSKDIAYVTMDHFQRFKEPVDVDALEAYAIKSGLPLRQAYKEFVAPKVDEQRNAEFDAKLKAAREEGARDALSKHQLPINTRPKEAHPFFDRSEKPDQPVSELQQDRNSKEAFLEAFNSYQEKAS